jgi:radical SAM superfamily enzyme YgiQ (UPF0313 family)
MKVLLMKPISDVYYVIQPSLGLGYLATILENGGHKVSILDPGKEKLGWKDFAVLIKKENYDLVGIQLFTHEVLSVKKHAGIIKEYSSHTTVICGGSHVSGDPQGAMQLLTDVDFGFAGEAEIGIEKFMGLKKEDYADYELLKTIPNLIWRCGEQIIVNPVESFKDLDRIKFPAWHLLSLSSYPSTPHGTFYKKRPVAPMIISRGCPFHCTFCAGKSVTGQTIRYRSVHNVISEIIFLKDTYGVKEIHIEDDNFTLKKEYVMAFCDVILKLGLDCAFALPNGVRLDTLDEEVLIKMEKAGFYSMAIGIESGSNRILTLMKKNLSREFIKEKINLIKKITRINLTGFFLMGYPGEREKEILETIDFAKALELDKASFMCVMPLPGSDLWDMYKEKGAKFDWNNFFYYRTVDGLSDVSAKNLRKLQKKAMFEFYVRPKIVIGLIKEIKTYAQIKIFVKRLFNIFIRPTAQ